VQEWGLRLRHDRARPTGIVRDAAILVVNGDERLTLASTTRINRGSELVEHSF
jgi:hypothetical protein